MSIFSDIERTIENGFRRWTEHVFGPADSDQLTLTHRAILAEIETKIQTATRGRRVFPYRRVSVTLISADPDRRALYQTAFGDDGRLESDVKGVLEGSRCEIPRGFGVEVRTAESGTGAFEIEYGSEARAAAPAAPARLVIVRGKAVEAEYTLEKASTNIGRTAELTDSAQRVARRNDVVFEEGADEANATVSRAHAHITLEAGEYRIRDDGSEYGTRGFRAGRSIDGPAGNRRGEKLRPEDEIYLGRACIRFKRG